VVLRFAQKPLRLAVKLPVCRSQLIKQSFDSLAFLLSSHNESKYCVAWAPPGHPNAVQLNLALGIQKKSEYRIQATVPLEFCKNRAQAKNSCRIYGNLARVIAIFLQ